MVNYKKLLITKKYYLSPEYTNLLIKEEHKYKLRIIKAISENNIDNTNNNISNFQNINIIYFYYSIYFIGLIHFIYILKRNYK